MAAPKFAHIGMNHVVQVNRVIAVIPPNLKSGKRYLEIAKNRGIYIDASRGRLYRSLQILDDGTVISSAISVMTIMRRFNTTANEDFPDPNAYDDETDMLDFDQDEDEDEE